MKLRCNVVESSYEREVREGKVNWFKLYKLFCICFAHMKILSNKNVVDFRGFQTVKLIMHALLYRFFSTTSVDDFIF